MYFRPGAGRSRSWRGALYRLQVRVTRQGECENPERAMHAKRSVPASSVVPVLAYPDVPAASDWLCYAFGFRVQFRDGEHRAHLAYGNGSVILVQGEPVPAHVQVRVEDASAHRERAEA